ncbi:hypothetical protein GCM10009754_53740 [Amycolatopsis minnesotensis]|uniref:Uncharacterized protein n=1 Tax=Amycolatopsis minnesotensis TaxID=337894 RepID=A0ABP5D4F3_9PSEU
MAASDSPKVPFRGQAPAAPRFRHLTRRNRRAHIITATFADPDALKVPLRESDAAKDTFGA